MRTSDRPRVGLVGCVKSKRADAAQAKDLYVSPLFRGQRQAVEASCDRWYVLSAEHGLLDPDRVIEPYEKTLNGAARAAKRAWATGVLGQLRTELGELAGAVFEVHAGKDYYDHGLVDGLRRAGATVEIPTAGLSLGRKLRHYRGGPSRPPTPPPQARPAARPARTDVAATIEPPRGKYLPLYAHLSTLHTDRWVASFADIKEILSFRLPASARDHAAWWANDAASHSHVRAWLAAGFHTFALDLTAERISFRQMGG